MTDTIHRPCPKCGRRAIFLVDVPPETGCVDCDGIPGKFTAQIDAYLEQILETGLYGFSRAHVIERLVTEGIKRAIDDGLIDILIPKSRKPQP